MNEVIGYVDVRAEEVAAAKADDVLEPAEQAKDAAQAAQAAAETAKAGAEAARDTTLAALPAVNERIDDVESDLNAVTLRVTTTEGDIVTIQGRITAVETKNNQQDASIAGLVAADAQNVKINDINQYAVGLSGNQRPITGNKQFLSAYKYRKSIVTFGSAVAGWRKLWTFTGRCSIRMSSMSVSGQYRSVGSTDYMVEFYSATMDNTNNKQTIIARSVANNNMIVANTFNAQTGEEIYCIYGRVAPSSNAVFMITEAFNEDGTAKTNFIESNDTTSYQLTDIGTNVTIGASL